MKRLAMTMACLFLMSLTVWAQAVQQPDTTAPLTGQSVLETIFVKQSKEGAQLSLKAIQQSAPFIVRPVQTNQWNGSVQWNTSLRNGDPLAALQIAPGTWWNDADTATRLSLTKDQQKKMDDIFQQFRLKLIDLNAALAKEELIMTPLIESERLDEPRILTQIDKIAQARAELEKANARMLLGIRQTLTMEQWSKIQSSPNSVFNSYRLRK